MQKNNLYVKNIACVVSYMSSICILILITDIIYTRHFERMFPLRDEVYLQMAVESLIYRHSEIKGLFYELKPNAQFDKFKTNSWGMRDHEPYMPKDSYRVLVMGDSMTFGPEVESDQLFTEVAERILNNGTRKVEILNAGTSGYNTRQEFIALKEKYLTLQPDMVIFAFCTNDTGEAAIQYLPDDFVQKRLLRANIKPHNLHYRNLSNIQYLALVLPREFPINYSLDRWLLLHSGIYRTAALVKFKLQSGIKDWSNLGYFLFGFDYNSTLSEIKSLSKENGFLLRFMILPTISEWDRNGLIQNLLNNNIAFWDASTELKKRYGNISNLLFPLPKCHMTMEGHRQAGRLLVEEIKSELN